MNAAEAIGQIERWLLTFHPEREVIPPDMDLLSSRILDSLKFLELVERLTELTGEELDLEEVTADSFQSLDTIRRRYLSALEEG